MKKIEVEKAIGTVTRAPFSTWSSRGSWPATRSHAPKSPPWGTAGSAWTAKRAGFRSAPSGD